MAGEGKQASGNAWGDGIRDERKAELEQRLQSWEREADQGKWKGPFDWRGLSDEEQERLRLTGADVFWLAARTLAGTSEAQAVVEQIEALRQARDEKFRLLLDSFHLEGADLSEAHLEGAYLRGAHLEGAELVRTHLEGANLEQAHLKWAHLFGAHLEGANLRGAHLECNLTQADLKGADLGFAYLEGADFNKADLRGANLAWAHLEEAYLKEAHLEGADLFGAHLERANLDEAHLEGAALVRAHLEGANLEQAHLEAKTFRVADEDYQRIQKWMPKERAFPAALPPADLREAFFDSATTLTEAVLGEASSGSVSVADVRWGEVNLAVVDWSQVGLLGDECMAREFAKAKTHSTSTDETNEKKPSRAERREARRMEAWWRLRAFQAAARASRQVATALRNQGLTDEADRFAYRAQLLHRVVLRRQAFLLQNDKPVGVVQRLRTLAAYLGSALLDLIAGYGYRPVRSLVAYVIIICTFAGLYLLNGQSASPHLRWDEALVLSISSFHGRGFFTNDVSLGDTLARLAAGEAIVGLLLEITFIATFTNRFFAR